MGTSRRAFWISDRQQSAIFDIDTAMKQGHSIEHVCVVDKGVLVITDGTHAVKQNDQRNRDAHERCPISIRVVCGSGSRDCSAASVGAGQ